MSLAGELLERAARATPATAEDRASGWWFRHTDGLAWWSGAVLAHDPRDSGHVAERIEAAERFYAEHRAAALFQVCPACPPGLDRMLADRGYRRAAPISLQVLDPGGPVAAPSAPGLGVRVHAWPQPEWLAVLGSTGGPRAGVREETRLLGHVALPSAYVTVLSDDEPVAIGRAVADGGWTGVFGMATLPPARRRGAARLVLSVIAHWAGEQHAPRLYLQVERSNTAACRLYAAAGFTEVATYHYRVGALPAGSGSYASSTGERPLQSQCPAAVRSTRPELIDLVRNDKISTRRRYPWTGAASARDSRSPRSGSAAWA